MSTDDSEGESSPTNRRKVLKSAISLGLGAAILSSGSDTADAWEDSWKQCWTPWFMDDPLCLTTLSNIEWNAVHFELWVNNTRVLSHTVSLGGSKGWGIGGYVGGWRYELYFWARYYWADHNTKRFDVGGDICIPYWNWCRDFYGIVWEG